MTLDEIGPQRGWCRGHKQYNCPYHAGRRGYVDLGERILAAMREAVAEWRSMGHKIKPMYPHDVWVYMDGALPHIQTMRKYMKQMAAAAKLVQVGARSGYMLPEYYGHVLEARQAGRTH